MHLITDKIESTFRTFATNTAITYINASKTYKELEIESKSIATGLLNISTKKLRVAILQTRDEYSFSALLGVLFSGNSYVYLDTESPINRVTKIVETFEANICIFDKENEELALKLPHSCLKISIESLLKTIISKEKIDKSLSLVNPSDMAFSIFTSGSTGTPKGVIITHDMIINYQKWFIEEFDINESTKFGAEAPIYFSISCSDTFGSLFSGASYNIIPKSFFTFPIQLLNLLNDKKINFLYMVPSAIGIIVNLDIFKYVLPKHLKRILFAGEVMPTKYVSYLQKYLPEVSLTNMFGPTETVDICLFYNVNRSFSDGDILPIGKVTKGLKCYILNNNKQVLEFGVIGELYVSGKYISKGYINNLEASSLSFKKDIFNKGEDTVYYKTGDLVELNDLGEYLFRGRVDDQIKHLGNRIELGEIERAFYKIDELKTCISIYLQKEDKIYLLYVSNLDLDLKCRDFSKNELPVYMRPHKFIRLDYLEKNQNGKIDRKLLTKKYEQEEN